MTVPTKADPLYERMEHAFGEDRVRRTLQDMTWRRLPFLLDLLTDEARDEFLRRCIRDHKLQRKFAAESRRHYRENKNVVR